jgi:sialic acid synthase SpsE
VNSHQSFHSPVLGSFPENFKIGTSSVGNGHPCYIIAEVGSNHDRNLDRALSFVKKAAEAKCNAVKFQTFEGPDIASDYTSELTKLPVEFTRWGKNLLEFYRNFSLPREFHRTLAEYAAELGIHFFSSPFSEKAVDLLADLEVPALKIASFEIVHLPLIRYAASTKIPLIISTGMAGLGDIERALEAVEKGGGTKVALLHCGSSYPLGSAGANLNAMQTLRDAFKVPIGYSDHTIGSAVPTAVAALGGSLLEKHVTILGGQSPDHAFALDCSELPEMVKGMRTAQEALGSSVKRRQPEEEQHALRGRRSIFSSRDISAGERFTEENLKIVRPGIGLEPIFLPLISGRKALINIERDQPLKWEHLIS